MLYAQRGHGKRSSTFRFYIWCLARRKMGWGGASLQGLFRLSDAELKKLDKFLRSPVNRLGLFAVSKSWLWKLPLTSCTPQTP